MFGAGGPVHLAAIDAEVVRRLRAAGAVIVGKTNTCELGQWPFTSGPGFGHTRTRGRRTTLRAARRAAARRRWRPVLSPRRSVRTARATSSIPAAWTHLVGIKPQRGRISTWPLPEAFNGITVNGVLARTVLDAALVLDAASGNVDGDLHKPPPVRAAEAVGACARPAQNRAVDQVPVQRLPRQAAPRYPGRHASP